MLLLLYIWLSLSLLDRRLRFLAALFPRRGRAAVWSGGIRLESEGLGLEWGW